MRFSWKFNSLQSNHINSNEEMVSFGDQAFFANCHCQSKSGGESKKNEKPIQGEKQVQNINL